MGTRAVLPAFFSRKKKNYLFRRRARDFVRINKTSLFVFVVTKLLSFFSGSFQRPSASTTFASIIRLTTYFRGGTEQFRANFIFSLVSSSLSKLSIPPDHFSFSTFFFSLVFCHFQLPARAQIKKKRRKRSESLSGIFFVARGSSKSVLLHAAAHRGRIAKLEGVDQWESGKMHSAGSHWSTRFSRRAF